MRAFLCMAMLSTIFGCAAEMTMPNDEVVPSPCDNADSIANPCKSDVLVNLAIENERTFNTINIYVQIGEEKMSGFLEGASGSQYRIRDVPCGWRRIIIELDESNTGGSQISRIEVPRCVHPSISNAISVRYPKSS